MPEVVGQLRLHSTYRYPKPASQVAEPGAQALENFFEVTRWPQWPGLHGAGRAQLEKGIDAIRPIEAVDGLRRPAILIGTNPIKAGTDWTPWHDEIDPRNGFVRYYGDNKPGLAQAPEATPGNRAILAEFDLHGSNQQTSRSKAAPLLFFENVSQEGRTKGYRRFRGFGLVNRVERVIQIDRHEQPFVNYRYDCTLFSMKSENNSLSWDWIAARRDPTKSLGECLNLAPASWTRWVAQGSAAIENVRQQILTYRIRTEAEQLPRSGSREADVLGELYRYYAGPMKHRFEAVAERIAQWVFVSNGIYRPGWITRASGDRGIDFVGRLDLGTGGGPMRVVVAGQAKCQVAGVTPAAVSRLAAKLGRGWIGVFVSTGYFSQQAQMELQDDGFPILLVDGAMVGELISRECLRTGLTVRELIAGIDATYEQRVTARNAAEILSDE